MVNDFLFEDIGKWYNYLSHFENDKPTDMAQFWHICMCNVSYKIVFKVLYQRLKRVFPDRISETQFAFVADRQIIII